MSGRVFSRPRTRVYNSNYAAGESYYKSALDGLDRKYGRASAPPEPSSPSTNGTFSNLRASLERELPQPTRRPLIIDDEDTDLPQRRPKGKALLGEFDSIFESRIKNGVQREKTPVRSIKSTAATIDDDEIDQEFAESMKRIKARAARAIAGETDEIDSSVSTRRKKEVNSRKMDFSSKMIDSVAVNEEKTKSIGKKALAVLSASQADDGEDLMHWTAVKKGRRHVLDDDAEDNTSQLAAAARARKSRARLEDLEAEMSALEERGAAREKRLRDLRTLLGESEASSNDTVHSAVRVKKTIKSEKKVVSF